MYGDPLTALEHEAIATLLGPEHPVMEAFRAQLAACRIKQREFTGVGFYTQLVVPKRLAVAGIDRVVLTNAVAELEGSEHGVGFNLFVQGGMFDVLEGFTYDGPWPDRTEQFKVKPNDERSTRDLEAVLAAQRGT